MARPRTNLGKKPTGVSLQLSAEILELSHELAPSLPGATATAKLQGLLTRALLRERDELPIGARGHALRVLPNGSGLELVLRVASPGEAPILDVAAQWFEEQLERFNQNAVSNR